MSTYILKKEYTAKSSNENITTVKLPSGTIILQVDENRFTDKSLKSLITKEEIKNTNFFGKYSLATDFLNTICDAMNDYRAEGDFTIIFKEKTYNKILSDLKDDTKLDGMEIMEDKDGFFMEFGRFRIFIKKL